MTINISNSLLKKLGIGLLGIVVAIGIAGAANALYGNSSNKTEPTNTTSQVQSDNTNTPPASTPTPAPATQQPTNSSVDINALNAKLCKDVSDNARSWSQGINKLYFDAIDSWDTTYYGNYDSPEAQTSKMETINHTKSLYADWRNTSNPSYVKFCGSGGSIADVLYEPNYDAW